MSKSAVSWIFLGWAIIFIVAHGVLTGWTLEVDEAFSQAWFMCGLGTFIVLLVTDIRGKHSPNLWAYAFSFFFGPIGLLTIITIIPIDYFVKRRKRRNVAKSSGF